jgi:hypothetical protein
MTAFVTTGTEEAVKQDMHRTSILQKHIHDSYIEVKTKQCSIT